MPTELKICSGSATRFRVDLTHAAGLEEMVVSPVFYYLAKAARVNPVLS
jgi:hypothetical protein